MEKVQGPNKAMLAALAVAGLVLERTGVTPVRAAQSGHITPQGGAKGGPKGGQRASDGAHPGTDHPGTDHPDTDHPDTDHPDADHPGADADAPSEIPARGWWHVAKRAAAGFSEDRVMATAAGVTFYAMLAIFPAIASFISLYGLLADPAKLAEQLQGLGGVVPGGGIQIITDQVKSLTSSGPKALGFGFLIGLATSLWSANAGVKAFFDALNVVYHERERRSFIRLTLISFCFTLALIALIILALFAVVVIPVVLSYIGLGGVTATLLSVARWPVMLVAVALALSCMYRYGPSRRHARWRWVSWGSAFAALGWIVVSLAFSYYVQNFGSYNKTYGSLGAAMGFMTWIWVSAMVVLMGAELNAELEQQTDRDSTIGGEKPAGARGAFKADVKV